MSILLLQFLVGTIFLTLIFLHLTKKNFGAIFAYGLQSLAISLILLNSFLETKSSLLLLVVLSTFCVKVVFAPMFFAKLIKKHGLIFSEKTYLKTPFTLVVITILTLVAHSKNLLSLTNIIPAHHALLALSLSLILLSVFLIINHREALTQAIGVLSLENSIVAFAVFAGLEQIPTLQFGILFDILIWLVIAAVFVSMIYRHFGSLDTSLMKHLKD